MYHPNTKDAGVGLRLTRIKKPTDMLPIYSWKRLGR